MAGLTVEMVLTDEECEVLERCARRPKTAQALALRRRIVLAAAEGAQSKEIAADLGCTTQTVGRSRGRFARRGIDGLHDESRPGQRHVHPSGHRSSRRPLPWRRLRRRENRCLPINDSGH